MNLPIQTVNVKSWKFHAMLAFGVMVLSFTYGLTVGVRRQLARAAAVQHEQVSPFVAATMSYPLELPIGVTPVPLGDDVAINGKAVDIAMFVSERSPSSIVDEVVDLWKSKGIFAAGMGGPTRAVGIGIDRNTGKRYSAVAWMVPPTLRKSATNGMPVQGMISSTDANRVLDPGIAESRGEIGDVPIRQGGTGGAVFSSNDPGGRSQTGAYTNPGTVQDNVDYYRQVLSEKNWIETSRSLPPTSNDRHPDVASLSYRRGAEELTLLFSQVKDGSRATNEKTIITVILGPRLLG